MLKIKHFIVLLVVSILAISIMYIPPIFTSNKSVNENLVVRADSSSRVGGASRWNDDSTAIYRNEPTRDSIRRLILITKENYSNYASKESEEVSMSPSKEPFDYKEFITWLLGAMNGFFGLILLVKKVFFKEK